MAVAFGLMAGAGAADEACPGSSVNSSNVKVTKSCNISGHWTNTANITAEDWTQDPHKANNPFYMINAQANNETLVRNGKSGVITANKGGTAIVVSNGHKVFNRGALNITGLGLMECCDWEGNGIFVINNASGRNAEEGQITGDDQATRATGMLVLDGSIENAGTITMNAEEASGMRVNARTNRPGTLTDFGAAKVTNSGTITTTGTKSRGIYGHITGNAESIEIINEASGSITVGGNDQSVGILAQHVRGKIINKGTINSKGDGVRVEKSAMDSYLNDINYYRETSSEMSAPVDLAAVGRDSKGNFWFKAMRTDSGTDSLLVTVDKSGTGCDSTRTTCHGTLPPDVALKTGEVVYFNVGQDSGDYYLYKTKVDSQGKVTNSTAM
ncbi:MAG: hypothetical protein ACPG5T_08275, partial [Endozoicomonas sp.]